MEESLNPKCIAQSEPAPSGDPVDPAIQRGDDSFKNVQWSADGTCLIVTSDVNDIHTFVVPADLLADQPEPLSLSRYCTIPSCEPVNAVIGFPSFQLQDNDTTFVLSSVREHPIRLSSALGGHLVASYPIVNSMTEEYISPLSLTFDPTATRFIAGSDSLISVFDLSRPGQEPVTALKTGPKNSNDDRWNPATSMRGIVSALATEPASNILAAGTFTRHVALYASAGQGDCIGSFSTEGNQADKDIRGRGITQLHWSPCGRYLYVTERKSDGIMVYDIRQTGQLLSWMSGRDAQTNQRLGVDVFGDTGSGTYEVWAGGTDGKTRMWKDAHLQEGAVKSTFEFKAHKGMQYIRAVKYALTDRQTDAVTSTVVHRAGGVIATSGGENHPVDENDTQVEGNPGPRLRLWTM